MTFLSGKHMIIIAVMLVVALLIYLYVNKIIEFSIPSVAPDNPFVNIGASGDTSTWHNSIGQNQIAVASLGLEGAGEPPVWVPNYPVTRPGVYGKHQIEFKEGVDEQHVNVGHSDEPAEHGHPAHNVVEGDLYGDRNIYNTWSDPMGVFPQNKGAFPTKRLVRNRDWANVLVGVPGATNEEYNDRIDRIFFPGKKNVTPEDRERILTNTPLNDPLSFASNSAFVGNTVYNVNKMVDRFAE